MANNNLVLLAHIQLPYCPYCPEQVPMGARSSSTKNWGWAVTRRMYLNGSTSLSQRKLAAMGPNRLASSVSSVIRWGQPDSGESCIKLQSGLTRC